MKEIWKDIKNYEGLYQISNLGKIKTLGNNKTKKEKIKSTRNDKKGYEKVDLCKNGQIRTFFVHRLVAQAFISNVKNLKEINHKDENPKNNVVTNLEWCDRSYNINYGSRNKKVSEAQKGHNGKVIKQIDINGKIIKIWQSMSQASKELKINVGNISNCCKNKKITAGGYKWELLN